MWTEERLRRVVATILGVDAAAIGPAASKDTIGAWDSLRHMNLILALEEELGVTIPDEEAAHLTSWPLIRLVAEELAGPPG